MCMYSYIVIQSLLSKSRIRCGYFSAYALIVIKVFGKPGPTLQQRKHRPTISKCKHEKQMLWSNLSGRQTNHNQNTGENLNTCYDDFIHDQKTIIIRYSLI